MANLNPKRLDRYRLPGSSLEEVFKVVQGYANCEKPASLADVARATGMHHSSISRNVGFLLAIGVLEGSQKKAPTEIGRELGLALMHDVPDKVESILKDIVSDDEFLKNVIAAVRIRKGMDESSLRAHIAYSAGQSKTGSTTTGTGAIVDLLKRSGVLKSEDGKLTVSARTARSPGSGSIVHKVTSPVLPAQRRTVDATSPLAVSIKIEVHCEPQDLDDLGKKLRNLVDDFSN